jgi:hypothetical protein
MTLTSILFVILLLLRIVIAVLLTRTGLRREARPVLWLAGLFYLNIVYSLSGTGLVVFPQSLVLIFQGLSQVCLVFFVHNTFYNNRRSPMPIFLGITILLDALGIFFVASNTSFLISATVSSFFLLSVAGLMNWTWHAAAAREGYHTLADDKHVQDWVKSRYKLMIAYCLLFLIPVALVPFVSVLPPLIALMMFLLAFAVLVVQYLVWGMPEPFRRWLNRNYVAPQQAGPDLDQLMNMSEEELMNLMKK